MSTFATVPVVCPECGTEQHREVATSLNAARSPHLRDAILAQTFQVFVCDACTRRFLYTGTFPYLDLERRQLFGVFPVAEEIDWPVHEARMLDAYRTTLGGGAPPVAQTLGTGVAVRCVFGLPALREKLVVAGAGLDDVLVEAVKLDVMRSVKGLAVDAEHRPRVVTIGDDEVVLALPPGSERLPVDRRRFDAFVAEVSADRAALADALGAGPYVDLGRVLLPR